ncbi:unnamed protein product [Symbiodinium sp. CCMP2456]|nr:unnamed protein product [Symbiodinium sp. CCMP2456]
MASTTLLCFYQLAARILMDSLAHDYINGVNLNDPMAVLGFVTGGSWAFFCLEEQQQQLLLAAQGSLGPVFRVSGLCLLSIRQMLLACLIGLRVYHSGVLLAGYGAPRWLSTLARFSRISYRFLMCVAHFLRARAYLEHPLNERLSAQMRSNMATLSQMMAVAIFLGTSTDFLVVARGVVLPDVFSQDFTDAEMDTLNDLFTQWLPVTLIITGTIDKRAPQQTMNDLRACGFNNGLVLFFLYLGTFLFGAGSVEQYTTVLWGGNTYAWLWPWGTGVLILLLGLILYISFWAMKRILCLWMIDRTVKRSRASQISCCGQRIVKMLNAQGQFNGAILVLRSEDTFVEAEPGAVLLQVVGVNGRHPLTQIAYPSPSRRNRWQVEYHIRLQPNAEKQNWAHRLYDHARAREGTEEPIHLEVAGPMNTLGTFGQEELLKDVHRLLFVAIGVGFTGCVHPMFHAHERLCIRTPSPEYADAVEPEPVCLAYGLRRGDQLRISISEDSSQAKPEERQSRSQWGKMLTGEVEALSKGGGGLVLLFCCGPSPAVQGVQKLRRGFNWPVF